jgi:hypothetical protein
MSPGRELQGASGCLVWRKSLFYKCGSKNSIWSHFQKLNSRSREDSKKAQAGWQFGNPRQRIRSKVCFPGLQILPAHHIFG